MNVSMLSEDLSESVMPYSHYLRKAKGYSLSIEGSETEVPRAKQILGSLAERGSPDDEELVEEAVRELAKRLAWFGEIYFEIYTDRRRGMVLGEIPRRLLTRVFFFYAQGVPIADWRTLRAIARLVRARSVWHLTMPPELGGCRGYRRLLRRLRNADPIAPRDWNPANPGFASVLAFGKLRERYIARCTRTLGWNWRNSSQSSIAEYYYFHRTISFCRSQAILRDHIVRELNALLRRLAIRAEIRIIGLPTPDNLADILNQMRRGEISFAEAYDAASPY